MPVKKKKAEKKTKTGKASRENAVKKVFGLDFSKGEKKKALKFLFSFTLIFLVLYASSFLYLEAVELAWANVLLFFFSLAGEAGVIVSFLDPVTVSLASLSFQLSFLCTGLTEFFVLTAAVLASHGIPRKEKIYGLVGAFDVVFLFNLGRIMVTVSLLKNAPLAVADLAHDFLFRVSLFVVIAGFYALWFYWATRRR
jgi:exosortase/archaeosortase family protein